MIVCSNYIGFRPRDWAQRGGVLIDHMEVVLLWVKRGRHIYKWIAVYTTDAKGALFERGVLLHPTGLTVKEFGRV